MQSDSISLGLILRSGVFVGGIVDLLSVWFCCRERDDRFLVPLFCYDDERLI